MLLMYEINKNLFLLNEVDTLQLKLRPPILDDIPILCNLWRDKKVRKFLGGVISDDMINEKSIFRLVLSRITPKVWSEIIIRI